MTEDAEEDENDEKTDADSGRKVVAEEEWGAEDRTDVDARPPVDAPREGGKPR